MIGWWRKTSRFAVANHTFSRIKTGNHHTFSRIATYNPTKILHPLIKYPTNIAIFVHNKVSKRASYKRSKTGTLDTSKARKSSKSNWNSIIIKAKPKLEPLFHHEFSAETRSRATRNSTWTIGLQSVDIQQPSETASKCIQSILIDTEDEGVPPTPQQEPISILSSDC